MRSSCHLNRIGVSVLLAAVALAAAPPAGAQIAAVPPSAMAPSAAPEASPPEVTPPAEPEASPPADAAPEPAPAGPPPGYRAAPPRYYYFHHRYRPMPYRYPVPGMYPPPAVAESMVGFHAHDGFYLRLHAGIGATGLASKQAGVKTSYTGGGASFGLAVGGTIAHNLILYGAVFGTDTGSPDKQIGGTSVPGDFGEIGVAAVGPGLTYYFEGLNLYLSAAVGLAAFEASDNDGFRIDASKSGAAFDFMVGKEWWVSRDWGMGIGGELFAASMKDKDTPGLTWAATGLSVFFSATYN